MKNIITYTAITLSFSMMLLGCYTEKRAAKQLTKVQAHHPIVLARVCSSNYPPIERIKDSIVYKQGEPYEEIVYVEADCDSVINATNNTIIKCIKVPCPTTIVQTDTLLVYKEKQVVNRAKVDVLEQELAELKETHIKTKDQNHILLRVAIILGVYTIIRWILRIWNIKLP